MTYIPLVDFEDDYEICIDYPYRIRRIGSDRCISDRCRDRGYTIVSLNGRAYRLHRLIAQQFIENDDPENKTEVDHRNKIRDDNHISNLRWATSSTNERNKTCYNGIECNYVDYDDEPDDLIVVDEYGAHQFEDYYYSPMFNRFYFDTGVALRELHINIDKHKGSAYVCTRDIDNKKVKIYLTRFKKLYGLD